MMPSLAHLDTPRLRRFTTSQKLDKNWTNLCIYVWPPGGSWCIMCHSWGGDRIKDVGAPFVGGDMCTNKATMCL